MESSSEYFEQLLSDNDEADDENDTDVEYDFKECVFNIVSSLSCKQHQLPESIVPDEFKNLNKGNLTCPALHVHQWGFLLMDEIQRKFNECKMGGSTLSVIRHQLLCHEKLFPNFVSLVKSKYPLPNDIAIFKVYSFIVKFIFNASGKSYIKFIREEDANNKLLSSSTDNISTTREKIKHAE